ncbi:MAG: hypothetical protein ACFB9M_12430 [Myxococcota bacterium]
MKPWPSEPMWGGRLHGLDSFEPNPHGASGCSRRISSGCQFGDRLDWVQELYYEATSEVVSPTEDPTGPRPDPKDEFETFEKI